MKDLEEKVIAAINKQLELLDNDDECSDLISARAVVLHELKNLLCYIEN